ncbi:MAG: hypothetical protein ACR5K2_02560 [Wolbachia sp.]
MQQQPKHWENEEKDSTSKSKDYGSKEEKVTISLDEMYLLNGKMLTLKEL